MAEIRPKAETESVSVVHYYVLPTSYIKKNNYYIGQNHLLFKANIQKNSRLDKLCVSAGRYSIYIDGEIKIVTKIFLLFTFIPLTLYMILLSLWLY